MSTNTGADGVNHRARASEAYRLWWQHDANWYQGVAARFGQEVANEINAEALRKVALHVGQRVARLYGPLPDTGDIRKDLEELRRRYDDCGDRMFPPELRNASTEVEDDDLIVLTLKRNFAITMVRMAGSLDGYRCPCTDIHAGWSEGLGVTLTENRAESCLKDGDKACRLLMRVATPIAPVASVTSAALIPPTTSTSPVTPMAPAIPAAPIESAAPTPQVTPALSTTPVSPAVSAAPTRTVTPTTSATSATPTTSATPVTAGGEG